MCNDHKALFMERKHVARINVVNPKKTRDIPEKAPRSSREGNSTDPATHSSKTQAGQKKENKKPISTF